MVGSVIREISSNIIVNSIRENNREVNYNGIINLIIKEDGIKGEFINKRPGGGNIRRRIAVIYLGIGSVYNREAGRMERESVNKMPKKGNIERNLRMVRIRTVNIIFIIS